MTSGQKTERVHSYNPGARTGHLCMKLFVTGNCSISIRVIKLKKNE